MSWLVSRVRIGNSVFINNKNRGADRYGVFFEQLHLQLATGESYPVHYSGRKILGLIDFLTGTMIPDSALDIRDQCVQLQWAQMRHLYPSARGCGIVRGCPIGLMVGGINRSTLSKTR